MLPAVVAAEAEAAAEFALGSGAFAHGVDGAAGFAVGLGEAGCAAHDFDVVVECEVGEAFGVVDGVADEAGNGGGNAVFFDLVDVKAARLEAGAVGIAQYGYACGGAQRVFKAADAASFELGFGDDADRLRGLFG